MKYSIKPKNDSEIISFNQSINDYIIEQLDDSETHNWIKDLTEFGMAASYITCTPRGISIKSINPMAMHVHAVMPAVIDGLNHNIIIADDIEMKEPELIQFDCCKEQKQPKENHPYGWYRKFDKKRF